MSPHLREIPPFERNRELTPWHRRHTVTPSQRTAQAGLRTTVLSNPMRVVNGYPCRNCADEELAKRGVDPAHPNREFAGSEVYAPRPAQKRGELELGVNRVEPNEKSPLGRALNLFA